MAKAAISQDSIFQFFPQVKWCAPEGLRCIMKLTRNMGGQLKGPLTEELRLHEPPVGLLETEIGCSKCCETSHREAAPWAKIPFKIMPVELTIPLATLEFPPFYPFVFSAIIKERWTGIHRRALKFRGCKTNQRWTGKARRTQERTGCISRCLHQAPKLLVAVSSGHILLCLLWPRFHSFCMSDEFLKFLFWEFLLLSPACW